MFVLPPPPRYPAHMLYSNGGYVTGQTVPMIETNNTITNPTGPDCQFLVGEGLYVLEEDLLLATPPPHPSETPVINPNPLATTPQPATAGTKLSPLTLVDPPQPRALSLLLAGGSASPPPSSRALVGGGAARFASVEEHPGEGGEAAGRMSTNTASTDSAAVAAAAAGGTTTGEPIGITATAAVPFPDMSFSSPPPPASHALLSSSAPTPSTGGLAGLAGIGGSISGLGGLGGLGGSKAAGSKQRKPKNNMAKSNSSFISRVIVHDSLAKRLQERAADGLFVFANINRAFQWLDMASERKADYLTKILFTKAHCLCHAVNGVTKSATHVDVVMGFSTGEIIWWEPVSQRYTRLNKNGAIRGTPVAEIQWLPGSETLFMAAFFDGSLVIFDKEKEDAIFVADEDEAGRQQQQQQQQQQATQQPVQQQPAQQKTRALMQVERSVQASRAGPPLKTNPFAFWKLSNQRINAFAFAPAAAPWPLVAVVSEDGSLRILDYVRETLVGLFYAYYGGLTCVCWSPDGKYVVTGGQDDLLSIWSVADAALVARCQGHHSWVTAVAFDPWRCDDRVYRFGSVGEDGRLCLWDFSVGMLIRPKAAAAAAAAAKRRPSVATAAAAAAAAGAAAGDEERLSVADEAEEAGDSGRDPRVHPVEPLARTAILPPVCSAVVDKDPLCSLLFMEKTIMTSSKTGHIRTWRRPTDNAAAAGEA